MTYRLSPAVIVEADAVIDFLSKDCPVDSCSRLLTSPLYHPGGILEWPKDHIAVVNAYETSYHPIGKEEVTTRVYIQFHKLLTAD